MPQTSKTLRSSRASWPKGRDDPRCSEGPVSGVSPSSPSRAQSSHSRRTAALSTLTTRSHLHPDPLSPSAIPFTASSASGQRLLNKGGGGMCQTSAGVPLYAREDALGPSGALPGVVDDLSL